MLTGIFSLVAACLYVSMDAVDVAFTEAAVGGGIATLLFLSTIALTTSRENSKGKVSLSALTVVLFAGGFFDVRRFRYSQIW